MSIICAAIKEISAYKMMYGAKNRTKAAEQTAIWCVYRRGQFSILTGFLILFSDQKCKRIQDGFVVLTKLNGRRMNIRRLSIGYSYRRNA